MSEEGGSDVPLSSVKRNRFTAEQSLLLAQEVENKNPFMAEEPQKAWDEVVNILNATKKFKKLLDVRTCKDRLDRMLDSHASSEVRNLVKSGTEELYTELERILTDLLAAQRDAKKATEVKKSKKKIDNQKRDIVTAEILEFGEKSHAKASKTDDSDWESDDEVAELKAMQEPGYTQEGFLKERMLQKAMRQGKIKLPRKESVEQELVKVFSEQNKMKHAQKDKEMEMTRGFKEKEVKLREEEIKNAKDIRMRELDLEERKLRIRERELGLDI